MSRPTDWSPLTWSDPVPGDPDQVRASARRYHETAEAIRDAARQLKAISDGTADARGKYIEEFRKKADGLAGKIERAFDRYDKTADALDGYAPELERAQDTADRALGRAKAAQEEAERWEAAKPQWSGPEPGSIGSLVVDVDEKAWRRHQDEVDRCQARVDDARDEIEKQRGVMRQAAADRDDAADKARAAIEDISAHDGLKDGFWDNVGQALKAIADVASVVATVCGVLSLVVGWIPVIGQALAAVLGTVALVAGIVALACTLPLAIAGQASWGDVAIGVVGVLSFGVGRAAGAALRLGSRAGRLAAVGSRAGMRAGTRGVAAGLRSSRVAGNARVASASRWLAARGTPLAEGAVGSAWRDTAAATRTFTHEGFTTAFRGQSGLRGSIHEVWQGVRNPRRLYRLQDDDTLKMLFTGQAGEAVKKTYFADTSGVAYSGGALGVATSNFALSNGWLALHDVPQTVSPDGPVP